MDNKYAVYFFDVDGTLSQSKSNITAEMSQLLSELSHHAKIAIISGAHIEQLQKQVIDQLEPSSNLSNIFLLPTSGGSLCIHNEKWEKIYDNMIDKDDVVMIQNEILQAFDEHEIDLPVKTYGKQLEYRGSQVTFSALGQEAPLEIKKDWDPDHVKRQKIVTTLTERLPQFDSKIGGTNSIDITLHGIDKAYGIKRLTEYLNVTPADCVFIGDAIFEGGNDYSVTKTDINTISTSGEQETMQIITNALQTIQQ